MKRGRPKTYKIKMVSSCIKVPEKLYNKIKQIAEEEGVSAIDIYNFSFQEFIEHRTLFPSNYTQTAIKSKLQQIYSREEL